MSTIKVIVVMAVGLVLVVSALYGLVVFQRRVSMGSGAIIPFAIMPLLAIALVGWGIVAIVVYLKRR